MTLYGVRLHADTVECQDRQAGKVYTFRATPVPALERLLASQSYLICRMSGFEEMLGNFRRQQRQKRIRDLRCNDPTERLTTFVGIDLGPAEVSAYNYIGERQINGRLTDTNSVVVAVVFNAVAEGPRPLPQTSRRGKCVDGCYNIDELNVAIPRTFKDRSKPFLVAHDLTGGAG
ncbi:hypothetical protein BDP67DRAFT_489474 [Colletotrichum lupini]|nr:hypothetical protein BDP67DRAFT_489474 [Colletotrichum lupini]